MRTTLVLFGIIILSLVIVGCTYVICNELKETKKHLEEMKGNIRS